MSGLEIIGVNKSYGATQALFDVSLSVAKGEFVTLLGPSGSGKTTLLKILAGFEGVSSGHITLHGRDITTLLPEQRNFGLVFQGYALFPHMSVFDNIAYPLRVRRVGSDEIAKQVRGILELIHLSAFADRKPSALSGGQQQRVALARALVFKPEVLLLDEPMSALDRKLRNELQDELRDIHRSLGTTFINVTHDQEEAMRMSDRIAIMNHGRIHQYGSAFDLYRQPKSRFVADFLGKSNILAGKIVLSATGPVFHVRGPVISLPLEGRSAGPVELMVRPEDVSIGLHSVEASDANLRARVVSSTYSGDRALYNVDVPEIGQLLAYGRARGMALFSEGQDVVLSFSAADCTILG